MKKEENNSGSEQTQQNKLKSWWGKKDKEHKKDFIINAVLIGIVLFILLLALFAKQIFGETHPITQAVMVVFNFAEKLQDKVPTLLKSVAYIVGIMVISRIVRLVLRTMLSRVHKGKSIVDLLDSFVKYFSAIICVLIILTLWGVDTTTLLASVGVLGLVVGLGAQSLISDILSGLFIIFEKTFEVDDIVVIDGFRGTVKSIGIRNTKLVDAGGDTKVVCNSDIRSIVNMTSDLSIAACDVGIEYGESLERVELILNKNLDAIKERIPSIIEGPYYKGVAALGDSCVLLKIICRCKENDKFQTARDLNREIKVLFDKNDINIPFPQVVLNQPIEFKKTTKIESVKANEFVDAQKELSKHIGEEDKT
ncbi:MAG: mechanosensitive ion channel family protein [Clostridia bacterium]